LGKHISGIIQASGFPAHGKGLARRAAGDQFHRMQRSKIHIADILFNDIPKGSIGSKRCAGVFVVLIEPYGIEARLFKAQCHSTGSGK